MRIAYLSSSTIPSDSANSIHVMKMCQAIARLGHDVRLIAPDRLDTLRAQAATCPHVFYGVEDNFTIHREHWPSIKGRGYWYGLRAARAAKRWGAELAYGRNTAACFFAAQLGLPVLYESHFPINDSGRLQRALFRRLIRSRHFRGLAVITHALKEHYEHHWPELKGRITVAPDGADPLDDSMEPIPLASDEKRLQVGYAGNLYPGKGMEVVLPLARQCPWADFHVIGGTAEDLSAWLGSEHRPSNLRCHGRQPPSEVPRYLLAMDVLLLPNQKHVSTQGGNTDIGRWTSPLKAFEYMAAGRAILCSDVPVLREVAVHGRNALLCSPDQVDDWATALESLRDDPDLRKHLGKRARRELEETYTWTARAERALTATPGTDGHPSRR
ncbi:glycosyltransferase family 4 protein [Halorhodospira halophila]|uniref:Glycosyl transferase, group 1 n=1 Tax=Halorhodospira halophila (strain DSM 244 / SL1) TaxID=349124 RepID=A1WV43_HALHL|nr:glycosyltransferase family 4 protein [Halorhodospira halophila]ABM61555.1 glycosyl transferase, group 1 [Halorhodospira halophila SL1]MBK1728802.1 group 1 glycosyl transferase [Halorhodospira halophila]